MKTWIVKSGDEQWVAEGDEPFEAAVSAIKRRLPSAPIGEIMSVREPHVEDMSDECWVIGTERVLEAAGVQFRRRSQSLN